MASNGSKRSGTHALRQNDPRRSTRAKATRRTVILAVIVVLVIGGIAGVAIYRDRVMPFRTIVLEVDGTSINMRYFLKRVAMSGAQPIDMLQTLAQEEIIKKTATKPPYNITATAQDIDQFARDLARGQDETIGDAEFREWYRQQLNASRLSDAEYRELLRTRLLAVRMSEYLGTRLSTVAEQVFVNMIPVKDSDVAAEAKAKYDAGTDFAALARQYSVSPELKDRGGKVGWFPRGVLDPGIEETAFALAVRTCSEPIYLDQQSFVLIMVSDRVAARQIDDDSMKVLKSKALGVWLNGEYGHHHVKFHGFRSGYDSETDAWVQRQLLKMRG